VLDLCAAPGGKTTHLGELMRDSGRIVACDVDEQRLQTVRTLAGRLGLTCIETHRLERTGNAGLPAGPFDAALVDVPCSNTGVLGSRPEGRWRLKAAVLARLVALQAHLLSLAAERVRLGGAVVYSICSIEPEENQQVVRGVLERRGDGRHGPGFPGRAEPGRPGRSQTASSSRRGGQGAAHAQAQ